MLFGRFTFWEGGVSCGVFVASCGELWVGEGGGGTVSSLTVTHSLTHQRKQTPLSLSLSPSLTVCAFLWTLEFGISNESPIWASSYRLLSLTENSSFPQFYNFQLSHCSAFKFESLFAWGAQYFTISLHLRISKSA